VRHAALSSSWREIATALGVSKQAAHQRFKAYAKDVATELKTEQRAMKQARRNGDADEAAKARARRDELAANLRTAARELKEG
jgi:GAF domain-containing protein